MTRLDACRPPPPYCLNCGGSVRRYRTGPSRWLLICASCRVCLGCFALVRAGASCCFPLCPNCGGDVPPGYVCLSCFAPTWCGCGHCVTCGHVTAAAPNLGWQAQRRRQLLHHTAPGSAGDIWRPH